MLHSETQNGYPMSIPTSFHGYKIIKYLGCGSTSIVVLIEKQETHEQFAAKIMAIDDIRQRNLSKSVKREVTVLMQLDHPNIIKLYETFKIKNKDEEYYVIVMEYCPNGDLLTYAKRNLFKNEPEKKKMIYSFIEAIKYLHSKGVSHGDIKSDNILLDSNNSPKLCDFGFCRTKSIVGDESKNGTLYYAAPELFVKGNFDPKKADIYAVGITIYSICELQFPFKDGKQNYIIKQIMKGNYSISRNLDPQIRNIVEGCIKSNPKDRMTIDQILNSSYFNDVCSMKPSIYSKGNNIMRYPQYGHRLMNPNTYEPVLSY